MKGQYLAVETVFTFALGIAMASAVVTLFNQYNTSVLSGAEDDQVEMVHSEILEGMSTLRELDSEDGYGYGRYDLELPENIAGKQYTLSVDDGLLVDVQNSESYNMNFTGFSDYRISGSAEGGDVTILKRGNKFTLRAN